MRNLDSAATALAARCRAQRYRSVLHESRGIARHHSHHPHRPHHRHPDSGEPVDAAAVHRCADLGHGDRGRHLAAAVVGAEARRRTPLARHDDHGRDRGDRRDRAVLGRHHRAARCFDEPHRDRSLVSRERTRPAAGVACEHSLRRRTTDRPVARARGGGSGSFRGNDPPLRAHGCSDDGRAHRWYRWTRRAFPADGDPGRCALRAG